MEVIVRTNNHFAKKTLVELGGAEAWVKSLSKYLSEDAKVSLSLFTDKRDFAEVILDIQDSNKLHINAKSKNEDMVNVVNSVISKATVQLKKIKDKKTNYVLSNKEYDTLSFENIDKNFNLDSNIMSDYELIEAEKALEEKKNTSKYDRVSNRYVDYLYGIKDIENEIVRAKNHLLILNNILATELDTMLYRDYEALIASIKHIEKEIKDLNDRKKTYKMNIRDEKYINETIDEELNVLRLKRK